MSKTLFWLAALWCPWCAFAQPVTPIPGHAHNDYEHRYPLRTALENGFTSVEVDVHLVDDELYVSHDSPLVLHPGETLEEWYLKPLHQWIKQHGGRVYPSYDGTVYLLIDIKTTPKPAYERIKVALRAYADVLFKTGPDPTIAPPVTVVLSGNRPVEHLLRDSVRIVQLDGRPAELERKLPTGLMPVVSEQCSKILYWDGRGEPAKQDQRRLRALVTQTHRQGKLLRLWAAPDHPKAWAFLLDNGVDLINTDRIADFRAFYEKYQREKRQ